jgi:DNA/RNA endonuclease YhcR with UshA esterase domain
MKIMILLTTLLLSARAFAMPVMACDDHAAETVQDSTDVRISELYPAPASDEEEFIELENTGNTSVTLDGWTLADESGKTYVITDLAIEAGKFAVLEGQTTGITLNNTGDVVTLANADGELRDSAEYEAADSQASWSVVDDSWVWGTATPDEKNSASVATEEDGMGADAEEEVNDDTTEEVATFAGETSTDIHLNELIPNPTGLDTTDEWIEVVNDGTQTVSLEGWQLTDQTSYYTIGALTITPGEYVVFEIGDTGISLNNTGDTLYLIDPFGGIIHGTTYASGEEGPSWARNGDTWEWSTTPTPGETNTMTSAVVDEEDEAATEETEESEEADIITITEFRTLDDGQSATVEGVVSVLPNVFGTQYFYIQDDNAGVQVYSYSKAFPTLAMGDRVRVTGEKSSSREETRIKSSTAEEIVVLNHNEQIASFQVSTLAEEHEGMLVEVEGEVVERSSDGALLDDAIEVVIKSGTEIESSAFTLGELVAVVGIVSQSDEAYRVLPRSAEDIAAATADENAWIHPVEAATPGSIRAGSSAAESGAKSENYLLIIAAVLIAALVLGARYALWYKKQKQHVRPQAANTMDPTPAPYEISPHQTTPSTEAK